MMPHTLVCHELEKQGHLATKEGKQACHQNPILPVQDNPGEPCFIPITDKLLTNPQL
jgi:hypothetical protein